MSSILNKSNVKQVTALFKLSEQMLRLHYFICTTEIYHDDVQIGQSRFTIVSLKLL